MQDKTEMQETILPNRTEEVRDIIERMPNTFSKYVIYIICGILGLLLLFGFNIKYPDIVTGEITISAQQAPLQLIAEQNGKLKLNNIHSQDSIQQGRLLAWIDNPANPELIDQIKIAIKDFNLPTSDAREVYNKLPKNINLGDLTIPYATFLGRLKQLSDYQVNKLYDKQEQSLSNVLLEQQTALQTMKEKEGLGDKTLKIAQKFVERDSILLAKRIISQSEFDQTMASKLNSEDQLKSSFRNTSSIREQINNTENSIQQNRIVKNEKELELDLEVITSFNNLIDKINLWEKQYLIKSPLKGQVQFLKFWNENQFVQIGDPIFSIIPYSSGIIGQVQLPINGAGKVKPGQEVIVKLADYPYMEYGYIKAEVTNIALVSSQFKTGNNIVETYLVTLNFPNGLLTNYGTKLDFKFDAKGSAEIVTKDRRLIERFFDNLKYIGHSK